MARRAEAESRPIGRLEFHETFVASIAACATIDTVPLDTTALRAAGEILDGKRKRANRGFGGLLQLKTLRILSAWSVDDKQLEVIASCPTLEVLSLGYLRASTLAPLRTLRALRHVVIDGAPKLQSLEGIESLPELRTLRVENARKIGSLADVSRASGLTALALVAGIFKKWLVDSYTPLSNLTALRWLELDTVLPRDNSLKTLAGLRELRFLMFSSGYFPLEEVARLRAALPQLRVPALEPYWLCGGLRCEHCNTELLRMSGYRGRVLCPSCDAVAVRRHVARFEELVSAGAVGW